MTNRAIVAASPTPIRVGDRTLLMSPMTDEDHGIMDNWIQSRHVRIARATLPEDATDKQRELTERIALSQASMLTFMSGVGLALMENPEAVSMLFWCGIRHNHPEMTPDDIKKLLLRPENWDALLSEWNRINNNMVPKEKSNVKKKNKARRKAARKNRKRAK